MNPGPHFLLVGDSVDVAAITGMLERLPLASYGQVYLEADPEQHDPINAPDGVTVTWLPIDPHAIPGEPAARAVRAWVAEWMPEQRDSRPHPYIMWIGCTANEAMTRLYRSLAERLGEAHLHHPHH